jgi:hypothetical protein
MATSPQPIPSAMISNRNLEAQEEIQVVTGITPLDEASPRGFADYGDDGGSNVDDNVSISNSGSSSTKTPSGGVSESSPSIRSFSGESTGTKGVWKKITGHGNSEDQRICGARCLFFFVLLVAAVSLGTMVFVITSRDANDDFQGEVSDDFFLVVPLIHIESILNFTFPKVHQLRRRSHQDCQRETQTCP